ncbi:ABC transporter ATP-binding protein [Phycicoccus avicenniae]|uniref:ABC transporter ATP-binding protein n=1 Tax=Phycicoccus avicenniae TaxID=2828860 RepID=UPI003D2E2AA0
MSEHAVVLESVSVTPSGAQHPVLRDVDLVVEEGELALVVGRTGSGKSTLLGAMCGRVPHFTGGTLNGRVLVHGRDTREHRPRDLADLVGVVGQDPLAGFVTDTVEEELAYGMEQLGLPAATMRKRVEETLDVLGIPELRGAALAELSGGQQQRVAIGSVLTAHPRVILLDEPTSALDPTGAEEVLATITRLVHDLAVTVVVAEHRVERVLHYADRVVHVGPEGLVTAGPPAAMMETSDIASPVVELGRWAGWSPLPLSVRDARRAARDLRERLASGPVPGLESDDDRHIRRKMDGASEPGPSTDRHIRRKMDGASEPGPSTDRHIRRKMDGAEGGAARAALEATGIVVRHPGDVVAVADVDLALRSAEVAALMGRNGSGKSSLLWALQGSGARTAGRVRVGGPGEEPRDPADLDPVERRTRVGLVPQSATDLLYLDTVGAECAQADRESTMPPGTCAALLERLAPGIPADRHPRDLSEGQKLSLVLAVQLSADPPVILLDEPTRGLDPTAKAVLTATLRDLAARGRSVAVATHDVEFVAECADRVVVMAAGEVVADGPTAEVVVSSPAFAPQVAKVLSPGPWLTVSDVREAAAKVPR